MTADRARARRVVAVGVGAVLLLVACGGGDDDAADDPAPESTTSATTTVETTAPPDEEPAYEADLAALADDAMDGRDNQTPGSTRAQDHIVGRLSEFAQPLGDDYRHEFASGTNLLAVIPGSEVPDEFLILGAHYDHLGHDCPSSVPEDDICNGATDNAASVAAVLEIGRRLSTTDPPRRSVILALWDAEEDGLLGSSAYVADPAVPLADTVAYLNWDNLGSNLLPSVADATVMVGAETGGDALVAAAATAAEATDLRVVNLSLLFGQGRSDHAVFAAAGVPTVFSTDATGGCYHTAQDDLAAVDVEKLGREIDVGEALARELADAAGRPAFVAGAPPATFDDAASLLELLRQGEPDLPLLPVAVQPGIRQYLDDLQAMVDAGPGAFDEAAVGTLLAGAVDLVDALTEIECDAFVD